MEYASVRTPSLHSRAPFLNLVFALSSRLVARSHLVTQEMVRVQGAADIPGYYHHGSRIAVGPSLMLTYNSKADAIAACKNMGNAGVAGWRA